MNFNEAFSNNEFEELDKRARALNNKKKNMYKDVEHSNKLFEKEMIKGINACYSDPSFNFLPVNNGYKRTGDFVSGLPTPFDDEKSVDADSVSNYKSDSIGISDSDNKYGIDSSDNMSSDKKSLFATAESDVSTIYSSLPKKIKRKLKSNSDHLKKYADKDEKSVLNHLQKCDDCKKQLFLLFKNEGHIFPKVVENNKICQPLEDKTDKTDKKEDTNILGMGYKELKDIVILVMIGIIIIIFVDMITRLR
jgi:hypothetical protein